MIISRTPLRMSFVGGGSDLPSFYRQHEGAVLSTAIDKYVYVTINKKFDQGIRLAYSKTENVDSVADIEHALVKAALEMLGLSGGLEITTIADIPSRGTGLGSSSTFTVGLLNALHAYIGRHASADQLSRESCTIEIERCGQPIGKQDQYAAAFGGLNLIEFKPDDTVVVNPVICKPEVLAQFKASILVFYTGITRSASEILQHQSQALRDKSAQRASMQRMAQLAYTMRDCLGTGDLDAVGQVMQENWVLKKSMTTGISTVDIDMWYDKALLAGAQAGKLLGAGAGGFLLFLAPPERHAQIKQALSFLRPIDVNFEPLGSRIIFYH